MAAPPPKPFYEDVDDDIPDPDEDDLDDLDDMLDEFSSVPAIPSVVPPSAAAAAATTTTTTTTTTPAAPATTAATAGAGAGVGAGASAVDEMAALDEDFSEEDFAKHLQESMAALLGGMGADSKEMQSHFEDIFKQISTEATSAAATAADAPAPASGGTPKMPRSATGTRPSTARSDGGGDFQETIRKTIERMQASGDQATAAAAADGSDDFLSEMIKQMSAGGGPGGMPGLDGAGNEEDFSKMLMGMMEQLTNREILYEPMKELNERFPAWMAENCERITAEEKQRYEIQQKLVAEIVAKFDDPKFSDDSAADRQYIVERMQKMQDAGSPPSDLVGDMPTAQDAFGGPDDEACNPQ